MMPSDDLQIVRLEEFKILRLEPGDVLVFMHPGRISQDGVERLRRDVRAVLAKAGAQDVPVMVIEEGSSLGVLRPKA